MRPIERSSDSMSIERGPCPELTVAYCVATVGTLRNAGLPLTASKL